MTVSELIKELQEVPNQEARVDINVPNYDYILNKFRVDTYGAQKIGIKGFVELYVPRDENIELTYNEDADIRYMRNED